MSAWVACVLAIALVLGIAALLAEQACRLLRLPTRGCWLAAMALSALLPFAVPRLPRVQILAQPLAALAIADRLQVAPLSAAASPLPAVLPAVAPALSLALSLGMLAYLAQASMRLQRRARGWRRLQIGGLDVLLAPAVGPAVFGWWRPRVVLPEWLGVRATRERNLALAHERSHLQARDPQLLAASLLLLAAMPWCLPMWWQLRRLRCAIEVDCDRRVLRAGGDLVDYCETLIELGQYRGAQRGLMAAVSQPQSLLERRIRIMSARPLPFSRSAAIACTTLAATLATCAVAVAAELAPPLPVAPKAPHAAVAPHAAMAPHAPAMAPPPPAAPAPPHPHARANADAADPAATALEDAKREAEEAQERADEAKADAEAAEESALEAKRDAEQQAVEAQAAKHEAEVAAVEATARKQDAENAARALHAPATN